MVKCPALAEGHYLWSSILNAVVSQNATFLTALLIPSSNMWLLPNLDKSDWVARLKWEATEYSILQQVF